MTLVKTTLLLPVLLFLVVVVVVLLLPALGITIATTNGIAIAAVGGVATIAYYYYRYCYINKICYCLMKAAVATLLKPPLLLERYTKLMTIRLLMLAS